MSSVGRSLQQEWNDAVKEINDGFRESVGCDFTPSRLNQFATESSPPDVSDDGISSWRLPRDNSCQEITKFESLFTGASSAPQLLTRLWSTFEEFKNRPIYEYWTIVMEGLRRCQTTDSVKTVLKSLVTRLVSVPSSNLCLRHVLFAEFFLLKISVMECDSDHKLLSFAESVTPSKRMRDTYTKLSKLELHATGRLTVSTSSVMAFIESELLPISLCDVPFLILKIIALSCFDIDLFDDDMNKMWRLDILAKFSHWRSISSIHRWNDMMMKNSAIMTRLGFGGATASISGVVVPEVNTSAVTVAYEAPWIMPTLLENPKRKSAVATTSSSANVSTAYTTTARMVKMEGRRQSYKPEAAVVVDTSVSTSALCLVPDHEESGFRISRNSLDGLRDDWGFSSHVAQDTGVIEKDPPKSGIYDVLDDLLQSPTRPSTHVNSPASATRESSRIRKRLLEKPLSSSPFLDSPATVSKRPRHEPAVENEKSSIKDFLLDRSPEFQVGKSGNANRRERKVMRDLGVDFNIM